MWGVGREGCCHSGWRVILPAEQALDCWRLVFVLQGCLSFIPARKFEAPPIHGIIFWRGYCRNYSVIVVISIPM